MTRSWHGSAPPMFRRKQLQQPIEQAGASINAGSQYVHPYTITVPTGYVDEKSLLAENYCF
jgi:hypothetical protein